GTRITVWSLTPSRMGIMTSRLTWSKPSWVGSNFAGISLGRSLYVAGVLASSCAEAVPASVASARTNFREKVPATNRSLSGLMDDGRPTSRRDFLHTACRAMAISRVGPAAVAAVEDDPAGDFILRSQPKPEPRIDLPTDALPKPDGPKKRIAAIATAYFRYS